MAASSSSNSSGISIEELDFSGEELFFEEDDNASDQHNNTTPVGNQLERLEPRRLQSLERSCTRTTTHSTSDSSNVSDIKDLLQTVLRKVEENEASINELKSKLMK